MEECGLDVGKLYFCAHVDTIRRDPDGRVRYHYTILDFCARWVSGEPVAATDVSAAEWAPMDALEPYGLWSEAHRVIGIMKDEYGRPIHAAEKVLAMTFRDGKLVETSNQFAIGDAKAREARLAQETGTRPCTVS